MPSRKSKRTFTPAAALPLAIPPIQSFAELLRVLETELGFCTCASTDALPFLRTFLELAEKRTNACGNLPAFSRWSRALEDHLGNCDLPYPNWFVYGLEQRDLIWHGLRVTDVLITDKAVAAGSVEAFPQETHSVTQRRRLRPTDYLLLPFPAAASSAFATAVKVSAFLAPSQSTRTVWPSRISPLRSRVARAVSISFWRTRLSGRAP